MLIGYCERLPIGTSVQESSCYNFGNLRTVPISKNRFQSLVIILSAFSPIVFVVGYYVTRSQWLRAGKIIANDEANGTDIDIK